MTGKGLFDPDPFAQIPGQLSIDQMPIEPAREPQPGDVVPCPRCGKGCRIEIHDHAHCSRCFSGFRASATIA